MPFPRREGMILLPLLTAAAVLAPVRFSTAEAMAPSTAECTTCCTKEGLLCVVCAQTCTTIPNAYDHGSGEPCPTSGDPNVT